MEMAPEKFNQLSKEEKLEYYKNEVLPKIKWDIDEDDDFYPSNLEFYSDGRYALTGNLEEVIRLFHRIKPEPEYVQFTYEDKDKFMGKIVKEKLGEDTYLITRSNSEYVWAGAWIWWTYKEAFENLVFPDGSPFGKKV